ncbi:fungal specific transcription factor domain-containing protein [Purpureocillium lavendulum]|uniref:Fungal specific transcription factor domain-containing protein n=1 Tax=Purpureocillium lavendulum TaxID=1247861 RepID=A0AB34FJ69_9HYPO|nr:fungal specific transcription factor domain-containing protein [Purpureocillium lavendulum]
MHQTIHGPSDEDCLQSVADCLERAKKVVVLMGAGVSTAAHIPDFRSNMGLYKNGEVFSESATPDGGGIRGLSELVVLEEIMNRIKHDLGLDGDPVPAQFFDLIGGTSTGGLIALLLGRLCLSVPQARKEYVRIAEEVFSLPRFPSLRKCTFDGRKLEEAVKRLLGNRGDEKMLEQNGSCKVFVCAVPRNDVKGRAGPRLFRTYAVRENASFNCRIWEACRATSAAPTYFEPIKIGDKGEEETFVDGGLGYNNPVEQVLEEARRLFPGRKVACVVSIGTGVARIIEFPDSPKTSLVKLVKALKKMATESDTTAEKMQGRFANAKDTYFRFSVDRGLQRIGLEEWKELPKVRTFTTEYLHQHVISGQVNKVVKAILAAKIISQQDSTALIQLHGEVAADNETAQGSRTTLEWRPEGETLPNFHYTTDQLASHVVAPAVRRHWIVPLDRNPGFVGRSKEIGLLLAKVPPRTRKDICQRIALEGLGGIGKTQIALETAYQVAEAQPECSVFWVPAVDATTFENTFRQIGQNLEVPGMNDDKADIKALVKTALSRNGDDWLLIVDNADDWKLFGDASLEDWLPTSHKGSILFTTRTHEVVSKLDIPPADVVHVSEMSRSETIELMRNYLNPEQMSDSKCTTELLDFLADLPLAIKQASAYMDRTGITATRYLQHCRSSDANFVGLLSQGFEDRGRYKNTANTQNPVATTWLVSFRQLSRLAVQLLSYMSFLAEKDIPKSILPLGDAEIEADEAIGELRAYAFITHRASPESYDMHRLVRLAMRNWLSQERQLIGSFKDVVHQLHNAFPMPNHQNRETWVTYLPHAMAVLEFRDSSSDDEVKSILLLRVAKANSILGRYQTAGALYLQSLALRRQVFGVKHPDTLANMNNLTNILCAQGKYNEGEAMGRESLALRQEVLGDKHPDTLASMNSLINILCAQGKYTEGEAMGRETLALRREILGDKHSDTLASMNSLTNILCAQGKYTEGEAMGRETLALRREILGDKHPDTIVSMKSIAIVLDEQGKYDEAEAMGRETLALYRVVFGDKHPDTLVSMNNLALVLDEQGKYEEAEAMGRKTLVLLREVLGDKHPDTLVSMNNVARVLYKQVKYEEAEAMHRDTLALRREVLGDKHPDTLVSMNNLSSLLSMQGKYEEAEAMHRDTLALRQEVLGDNHPDTLAGISNLGNVLYRQRKYEEAEAMHRKTLALRREVLSDKHPDTLVSMNNLSNVLYMQGKCNKAEAMHRETLALRREVLGDKHPDTLKSMNSLAFVLRKQGKYEEAEV